MSFDNIFLFNWTSITTYFHPVVVDIIPRNFATILEDCTNGVRFVIQFLADNLSCPIEFTNLQFVLLTIFLAIFFVNLILIVFYWNKYGGVITDRFIRPSTLKEIEELKLSVAKLKLPFEHTPRI